MVMTEAFKAGFNSIAKQAQAAFFRNSTPVTDEDLEAVEERYGRIPDSIRKLVQEHNGATWATGNPLVDSLASYSSKDPVNVLDEDSYSDVPDGYLPFANDGAGGYLAVSTQDGRVVHVSGSESGSKKKRISKSLEKFLSNLGKTKQAQAESRTPIWDMYAGRTAITAGGGALLGALNELLKKKGQKRDWLAGILSGLFGGAAVGAGTLAFKRNVLEPILTADIGSPESIQRTRELVDRAVADAREEARRNAPEAPEVHRPRIPKPGEPVEPGPAMRAFLRTTD